MSRKLIENLAQRHNAQLMASEECHDNYTGMLVAFGNELVSRLVEEAGSAQKVNVSWLKSLVKKSQLKEARLI